MDETRKRIVLADDDTLLREGVASLLERAGFDVIGQARDGAEVLALVRAQRPDLAIMDIRMPPGYGTEGLDAARQIRTEFPSIAILVLSAHAEVEQATELLSTGQGVGYLLKSRVVDVADFAETVGRIAAGGSVVDPALVQELVSARHRDDTIQQLTNRERDVLALLAEGRSNAGIARQLWITEGTVEKHVRSILARLRLPETEDDHRRVLAVLAYLESLNLSADEGPPALRSMPSTAAGESASLGRNEIARASAIMSATSPAEWAEIRMMPRSSWPHWSISSSATSKPVASPS